MGCSSSSAFPPLEERLDGFFAQICPPMPGDGSQRPRSSWMCTSQSSVHLLRFPRKSALLESTSCCSQILLGIHHLTGESRCHETQTGPTIVCKEPKLAPALNSLVFCTGRQWAMGRGSQQGLFASPVVFPSSDEGNPALSS